MFEIVDEVIDERAVVQSVEDPRAGAICTFAGVVRDNSRGKRVLYLEYEAYAEMAVTQMQKIAAEMKARWEVLHVSMVHRTGRLEVGEASVFIAVSWSSTCRARAGAPCGPSSKG